MKTTNFAPYSVDTEHARIFLDQNSISLTKKEFKLAAYLFDHNGTVLSREILLEHVWGITAILNTRTVDAHVSRLRLKLELSKTPWTLKSVYGSGYCLYHTSLGIRLPQQPLKKDNSQNNAPSESGRHFLAALAHRDKPNPQNQNNCAETTYRKDQNFFND